MLLSSILSILDQHQSAQAQPKIAEKAEVPPFKIDQTSVEEVKSADAASSLKELQSKQAAEAGLLRPLLPESQSFPPTLEDLIKAVAKFEKKEPARVVDVFE